MAGKDWKELQAQFLITHADTGVSPKDWCEAQGLKYSTAKEHIRIKPRQPKTESEQRKKPNSGNKKPNSGSASSGTGRPSTYRDEYADQVRRLCMLGCTDSEIANFFEIDVRTVNRWKENHPDFCQSLKKGKLLADSDVVNALYYRALGYEHPEDDIRAVDGAIVITPTTKHYPPDTTAAIFWLKNRQRDKWRDKQEIEHTGEVGLVERIQAARKRARGEHDE